MLQNKLISQPLAWGMVTIMTLTMTTAPQAFAMPVYIAPYITPVVSHNAQQHAHWPATITWQQVKAVEHNTLFVPPAIPMLPLPADNRNNNPLWFGQPFRETVQMP